MILLGSLLGCYLIDNGGIDCAADEVCARDSLPEGDADTDADSDADTDVPGQREVGAVFGSQGGSDWSFVVVDPAGAEVLRQTTSGAVEGPLTWLDQAQSGLLLDGDQAWVVDADQAQAATVLPEEARDLEWVSPSLVVLFPHGLAEVQGSETVWLEQGAFQNATRLVADGAGGVWVLDLGLGLPSLYHWNEEQGLSQVNADFDEHSGRTVGLFLGPDQLPWVCSGGGAVWSVAALAQGDRSPARLADNQLSGVMDCGYDGGSDEFLLFSQQLGIVRLGRDNATSVWVQDQGLRRGRAYLPYE